MIRNLQYVYYVYVYYYVCYSVHLEEKDVYFLYKI